MKAPDQWPIALPLGRLQCSRPSSVPGLIFQEPPVVDDAQAEACQHQSQGALGGDAGPTVAQAVAILTAARGHDRSSTASTRFRIWSSGTRDRRPLGTMRSGSRRCGSAIMGTPQPGPCGTPQYSKKALARGEVEDGSSTAHCGGVEEPRFCPFQALLLLSSASPLFLSFPALRGTLPGRTVAAAVPGGEGGQSANGLRRRYWNRSRNRSTPASVSPPPVPSPDASLGTNTRSRTLRHSATWDTRSNIQGPLSSRPYVRYHQR